MIRRTLGAPFGGTTRGGQYGVESFAVSLITPPNFAGGGGSCAPSIVVVALGEPGTPLISWAVAEVETSSAAHKPAKIDRCNFMVKRSRAEIECRPRRTHIQAPHYDWCAGAMVDPNQVTAHPLALDLHQGLRASDSIQSPNHQEASMRQRSKAITRPKLKASAASSSDAPRLHL